MFNGSQNGTIDKIITSNDGKRIPKSKFFFLRNLINSILFQINYIYYPFYAIKYI